MSERSDQIESAADRIRGEFGGAVTELGRRAHAAADVRGQVRRWTPAFIGVGVAIATGLAGYLLYRRRTAVARRRRQLRGGLRRAWAHPERLAVKAPDRPLPTQLGRAVATTFAVTLATQLAKDAALRMRPGPLAPRH